MIPVIETDSPDDARCRNSRSHTRSQKFSSSRCGPGREEGRNLVMSTGTILTEIVAVGRR